MIPRLPPSRTGLLACPSVRRPKLRSDGQAEACPTITYLPPFHALGIKVRKHPARIISLLEGVVADLIVDTPERPPIVVRCRIQSLYAAKFGDLTLDHPVVVSTLVRGRDHVPESKVHIELVGRQRA